MIKFLQILDIPLKNWNQYVEPTGEFDLKGLLRDGQIRAYEKIGELQSCSWRNGAFRIRKNTGIVMDFTGERYRNGIF